MRLYELSQQWESVLEMAEQLEPEALKDTLDSIEEAFEAKVENTAKVIKSLDADVNTIEEEIKRLNARKTALKNNAANLKNYLQEEMDRVGKTKIKGSLFNVGIQNNPPSLRLADEFENQRYLIEVVPKYDKKAILADLKAGKEVVGAEVVQGRSLRIR